MGVYAYCVVRAGHRPDPELKGVNEAAVDLIEVAAVGVWVSRMGRPGGSVEHIKAHNAVVEAAVTTEVTPVPLRFGQWLDEEAELIAGVAEQAASYETKLQAFAGCLEFGIRVIDPALPEGARDVQSAKAASGTAYMQALRESARQADERRTAAERVRRTIQDKVSGLVRTEQEEASRTPHAVVTVSHLVPRENFDEYRERVRQLRETFPELRLLLSGPWPPYSFAV